MTIELVDAEGQPLTTNTPAIMFLLPTAVSVVDQRCSMANGSQLVPLGMTLEEATDALVGSDGWDAESVTLADGRTLVWNVDSTSKQHPIAIAAVDGNPNQCWVYGGVYKFLLAMTPLAASNALMPGAP